MSRSCTCSPDSSICSDACGVGGEEQQHRGGVAAGTSASPWCVQWQCRPKDGAAVIPLSICVGMGWWLKLWSCSWLPPHIPMGRAAVGTMTFPPSPVSNRCLGVELWEPRGYLYLVLVLASVYTWLVMLLVLENKCLDLLAL